MRTTTAILTVLLLVTLTAHAFGGADARATVEPMNRQFSAMVSKGDAGALAAMYADGAQLFPPNDEVVDSRDGIRQVWQTFIDQGAKGLELQTTAAERHGDVIIESGKYVVSGADAQKLDEGKYLVVWKRDGRQWKLYRDIWNSSRPAPPPAQP